MKFNKVQITKFTFSSVIFLIIIIIFTSIETFSYYNSSELLRNSIIQSMKWRTQDNADLLSQHLNAFKAIIQGVAGKTEVQSMDWNIQKPALIAETKRLNVIRFQVANLAGIANSTNGGTFDLSEGEWHKKASLDMTYITEPFRGILDNKMIIVCGTPIINKENNIIGVLAATLEPQFIYNIIRNIKVGNTGYGFIISKQGQLIAHPDRALIYLEGDDDSEIKYYPEFIKRTIDKSNDQIGYTSYKKDGSDMCATYIEIPNTDWYLFLSAPEKEVFNEIENLKYKYWILVLITIVLCCLTYFFVLGYISKKKTIKKLEKLVEEDERLLRESLELEQIRTQFFANISHEFRTPLNVILSSIQLLILYNDKDEIIDFTRLNKHLRTMKQNCYRLLRLVNNLIDTTRIDVGFIETHMENHNIIKIVEDITMSVVEFVEMKGIKLIFDTEIEEKIIACDVDKIERIILNLISNSIKFTDSGGNIFVNIYDRGDRLVISEKDTGIGIPKEKQEVIFQRFVQVEKSLSRNHEGSGIGLSMARSFVEMHDGTLKVNSEYENGSEFIIDLPVRALQDEEIINQYNDNDNQRRIERIHIEFSDIYTCNNP